MHSFEGKEGTIFNYSSDFSGKVRIKTDEDELWVIGCDLIDFIARCFVAPGRIREIEQATVNELLGVKP